MKGLFGVRLNILYIVLIIATLVTVASAGTSYSQITTGESAQWHPSYSPDGESIVFSSNEGGNWDIWAINQDGNGENKLTTNQKSQTNPRYSPNGKKIIYASWEGEDVNVWVMDKDGGNKKQLTTEKGTQWDPMWMNDEKILYSSKEEDNFDIWVMNADGTNKERITRSVANEKNPDYDPIGNRIVYSSKETGSYNLWVLNLDDKTQKQISSSSYDHKRPSWSPDGTKIAYISNETENWDVFIVNNDGSNPVQVTTNEEDDFYPSWSPSGDKIVFSSYKSGNADLWIAYLESQVKTNSYANETAKLVLDFVSRKIDELNSKGVEVSLIEEALNSAKEDFDKGKYDESIALSKNAINLANNIQITYSYIDSAQEAIDDMKSLGADTGGAEDSLFSARESISKSDYKGAQEAATLSKKMAFDSLIENIPFKTLLVMAPKYDGKKVVLVGTLAQYYEAEEGTFALDDGVTRISVEYRDYENIEQGDEIKVWGIFNAADNTVKADKVEKIPGSPGFGFFYALIGMMVVYFVVNRNFRQT